LFRHFGDQHHRRRFSRFSRNKTPVGRRRTPHRSGEPRFPCRAMFPALSAGFPGGIRFFQPLPPVAPTARLTVMPARNCSGRRHGVSTFHIFTLTDNLGGSWTPVEIGSRTGKLATCTSPTRVNTRKRVFDLLIPVGLNNLTARKDLCLLSPYCPFLALNRVGFPEGVPPHGFFPFRYVVRRAPHPVISATAARLPKKPAGTRRVTSSASITSRCHI